MKLSSRWLPICQAVIYAVGMLLATGLITGWGEWYSSNRHHRQQVEALLCGRLALSESPTDLAFDLAWSEGGVHQVWGLGVPLWRLPFVGLARLCGFVDFPDMFAFAIALAATCYFVLRTFNPVADLRQKPCQMAWINRFSAFGAVILLLLYPPFVTLLRTKFRVYEEVVAYEFLFGLVSLCGLIALIRRPVKSRFVLLCLWAGCGGMLRPPLMFYGFATFLTGAVILLVRETHVHNSSAIGACRKTWRALATGLAAFCLGGGVLFMTNLLRFGDGFEFGHKLNLQNLTSLSYTTRFTAPYEREPLVPAVREMFGVLFMSPQPNEGAYHRENFFPGQSSTLRWRDFYFSTYDLSHLAFLLFGLVAGATALSRLIADRECWRHQSIPAFVALWAGLALVPLVGFYLRSPLISSRYLLDFMPAFAALSLSAWLALSRRCQGHNGGLVMMGVANGILTGWLSYQMYSDRNVEGLPAATTRVEAYAKHPSSKPTVFPKPLPDGYLTPDQPKDCGIPYNGQGWNPTNGIVKPIVILFIDSPEYIELKIAPVTGKASADDVRQIRAKVGLELLKLQEAHVSDTGWTLLFKKPTSSRYSRGLQPLFIAFAPDGMLADESSHFILRSVQWRSR